MDFAFAMNLGPTLWDVSNIRVKFESASNYLIISNNNNNVIVILVSVYLRWTEGDY